MKKKLLSAILAGAMVLPTVVLPTSVGAEEANDSGTITVTYSPSDYVIYYGGRYANTHETAVSVNTLGNKKTGASKAEIVTDYYDKNTNSVIEKSVTVSYTKTYSKDSNGNYAKAAARTDQDKFFAEYKIPAVNAITDVDINLKNVQYEVGKKSRVNVYFSTEKQTLPEDGVYYYDTIPVFTNNAPVGEDGLPIGNTYSLSFNYVEGESQIFGAETKEEIDKILQTWNTITNNTKNPLIPTIDSTVFPELTSNGKYSLTKDVTAEITNALKNNGDEEGTLNLIYRNNSGDKRTDNAENILRETTFTVTYDKDLIVADVNTADTKEELEEKVKMYSVIMGTDVSIFSEDVINEKLPGYVGTTFTWESFEKMLKDLMPVDTDMNMLKISDLYTSDVYVPLGTTTDKAPMQNYDGNNASAMESLSTNYYNTATSTYDEKVRTVTEFEYIEADTTGGYDVRETGKKIPFDYPIENLEYGVKDAIELEEGQSINIAATGEPVKKLYMILDASGIYYYPTVVVNYTDGTKESTQIKVGGYGHTWVQKTSLIETKHFPDLCGGIHLASNRHIYKDNGDGTYTTEEKKNTWTGLNVWSIDVNPEKTPASYDILGCEIDAQYNRTFSVLAVTEGTFANAELEDIIAKAEKNTSVTDKNSAEILAARKYADTLIERNVAIEADFAKLNELVEEALWYAAKTDSEQIMLDISDKLNIDFMAPVGEEVERGWNGSSFSASIVTEMVKSYGNSLYSNGVRTFPLKKYETALNSARKPQTSKTETGEVVKISIPEERFEAGVRDGVYFEPKTGVTETFDATGVRAEALYIAWDYDGATQYYNITVNYADGTSETTKVRIAGQWFTGSPQDIDAYPCLASDVGFSGNTNAYSAVEGADGKYTIQMTQAGDYTNGLQLYEVKLDASKVPVNYVVTSTSEYDSVIYGLTEKTMSNDDMLAVIAEAEALLEEDAIGYVSTEEDAKLAKTAAAYARELDERHAVKLEDNQLVLELEEQAIAQDIAYLDLSAQADMDIIVKSGDTTKYASRDDSLLVDFDEYITAKERTDAEKAGWLPDPEAGTVYKLFGGWNGKGNDAVRVLPADEGGEGVVIDLNNEMYKHISFLVDSIDSAINVQTGATIYADVTYTDGETETVEITLRRGDSWYTMSRAAHYGKNFGSWNAAEGKYVNTGWVTGGNNVPEYAAAYPGRSSEGVAVFGFDIPSQKTVASVKLNAHEKAEYAIIGATATPYTNDELVEKLIAFGSLGIIEPSQVTIETAMTIIDGYNASIELVERNYSGMDADTLEMFKPVYDEALKYNIELDVLTFVPSILVENGNVTANLAMINTTEDDQDYILIIAAYDADNQLVGVKSADQATLATMTYSAENSISMPVPEGATKYKALVWESKDSMNPIAIIEK